MGFVLIESMTKSHEISFLCFVLTNFPTTSPRDLISNSNFNGTLKPPLVAASRLDPAPYKGTFVASMLTNTVRLLFLG
uniref:Harpin-induced protein n=1 Tax=Solanum tuberosum TaxID=4113 RepID=M0ZRX9_SOLTU